MGPVKEWVKDLLMHNNGLMETRSRDSNHRTGRFVNSKPPVQQSVAFPVSQWRTGQSNFLKVMGPQRAIVNRLDYLRDVSQQ